VVGAKKNLEGAVGVERRQKALRLDHGKGRGVWRGADVSIGSGMIRSSIGLTRDQAEKVMVGSGESTGGVGRCEGKGDKERT